jgi:hypothetical protein
MPHLRPMIRSIRLFGGGHLHRCSSGIPARACSTCRPHPAQVAFPHREHVTRWHMIAAFAQRAPLQHGASRCPAGWALREGSRRGRRRTGERWRRPGRSPLQNTPRSRRPDRRRFAFDLHYALERERFSRGAPPTADHHHRRDDREPGRSGDGRGVSGGERGGAALDDAGPVGDRRGPRDRVRAAAELEHRSRNDGGARPRRAATASKRRASPGRSSRTAPTRWRRRPSRSISWSTQSVRSS